MEPTARKPFLPKIFPKGLSLLEIIISLVLLSIVMAGMANLFIATKRYMQHSRYRMGGGELGKYFLDPLQSGVKQLSWSTSCVGAGVGCNTDRVEVGGINYQPSYTVTDPPFPDNNLRKVKVNITWNETSP